MTATQIPPHDEEAERAIVGALMIQADALGEVAQVLRPDQYYSEAHRRIFEAMLALSDEGQPIDVVQVGSRLKATERLKQVGGMPYLTEILGEAPALNRESLLAYAGSVRERWQRRETIAACQKLAAEGYHGDVSTDALVARMGDIAESLSSGSSVDRLRRIADAARRFYDRSVEASKRKACAGLSTGLRALDEALGGLHDGELTVIAARPGMGKSALVDGILESCAGRPTDDGGGTAFLSSLEMPDELVAGRHVAAQSRIPLMVLRRGKLHPNQWDAFSAAGHHVSKLDYWIDDTPAVTVRHIRTQALRVKRDGAKRGRPLRVIGVDYMQLMRGTEKGGNRESEISEVSRGLKGLAKELEVPVIALSQLNRSVETRSDKRPMLSDLRESGAIEQDADNVVFIYRDDYYTEGRNPGIAEMIVAKVRTGPTGTTGVGWDGPRTSFYDLSPSQTEEFHRGLRR